MPADGNLFLLDAVADRFETLLRRYQLLCKDIPMHFQQWLRSSPAQKRVFASFDSLCTEMFPEQLSVGPELPQRWMLSIACVALKQHVLRQTGLGVELSACGRALRVVDRDVAMKIPCEELAPLSDAVLCSASRIAALEVYVARLESGLTDDGDRKRARLMRPVPDSLEQVLIYLSETRLEALDSIAVLRKMQSSHRRQSESARMTAANAEISRLKKEIEELKAGSAEESLPKNHRQCILPKRALSLAGFWNLMPNDLLLITPVLIQAVEARGGIVFRREGRQVCFSDKDKPLLIEVAVETMAHVLPQYKRRTES